MEKSIKNAFTFMFKDPSWKSKLLILALFSFNSGLNVILSNNKDILKTLLKSADPTQMTLFFIINIVSLIASIFASGYFCRIIINISNLNLAENQELLPTWKNNFVEYFRIGILYTLGKLIAGIAVLPTILIIFPVLIFALLMPALTRNFCSEQSITAFFAWRKGYELVKKDTNFYLKIILTIFIIFIVNLLLNLFLNSIFIPIAITLIIIVEAYWQMVIAYLCGLIGKETTNIQGNV